MQSHEIQNYWNERAKHDSSVSSTTQDIFLREIEYRALKKAISHFLPKKVLDVGCGDARTTVKLAQDYPGISFTGVDYAEGMISNAKKALKQNPVLNLSLAISDVTQPLPCYNIDLIYTTRCLINLPSTILQKNALTNIYNALTAQGLYVMIENFIEGQDAFNRIRLEYDLPPIAVREHNLFFSRKGLDSLINNLFIVEDEVNISSSYYLMSRIVYSKICKDACVEPDYTDSHHAYASSLPFAGEYGPVRMLFLRRI